jgi:hypothetical protein
MNLASAAEAVRRGVLLLHHLPAAPLQRTAIEASVDA